MYKITLLAFHRNKTKTQTKIEQISHHSLICRLYSCIVKLPLRRRDSHNKMSHVISNLSLLSLITLRLPGPSSVAPATVCAFDTCGGRTHYQFF